MHNSISAIRATGNIQIATGHRISLNGLALAAAIVITFTSLIINQMFAIEGTIHAPLLTYKIICTGMWVAYVALGMGYVFFIPATTRQRAILTLIAAIIGIGLITNVWMATYAF